MTTVKPGAPVVGFNHNVKYGPRVYHCQTEDSGLPHAHYITHLFVGGNIVASTKTSYAEKIGEPELPKIVRGLMEQQHKVMLKRLVSGEFAEQAERFAPAYAPGVLANGQTGPAAVNVAPSAPAAASSIGSAARLTPPSLKPVAPAAKPVAPATRPAPPTLKPAAAPSAPATKPAAPAARPAAPPARPAAPVWQAAPPSASPRMPGAPLPQTTRMPGPPPTRHTSPPRLAPVTPPPALRPAVAASRAPATPVFGEPVEMPHEDLPTLFAEELISEKSLDEVILAFLSADLEPPK